MSCVYDCIDYIIDINTPTEDDANKKMFCLPIVFDKSAYRNELYFAV